MNRKFPRRRRRLRDSEQNPGERAERDRSPTEGTGGDQISPSTVGAATRRAAACPSRPAPRREPKKYG